MTKSEEEEKERNDRHEKNAGMNIYKYKNIIIVFYGC